MLSHVMITLRSAGGESNIFKFGNLHHRSKCSHLGGYLASIHNKDEDKFLFNLIQPHAKHYSYGVTWLGASCVPRGGWTWDDGTPWDYENWNQSKFVQQLAAADTFPWLESRPQNV